MEQNADAEYKAFLSIYFFELETYLNSSYEELKTIKFQSEEANTDEFIKRHFQNIILTKKDIAGTNFKKVEFKGIESFYEVNTNSLYKFKITNVYLPEELSTDLKLNITKGKKSVYTNPDLYLKIEDGNHVYYESLEIKSTKNNNIPGSSVQQITPFEWVIFIKRGEKNIEVSTGYYINSITDKIPFPDRSPRPQVGFNTLAEWNNKNRIVSNNVLTLTEDLKLTSTKIKLLKDWQDFLATEWMDIIKNETVKTSEKWFNNTLRKFAIKFLEYSNEMSENERQTMLQNLKKLVS